jgi:hypothetical protein
MHEEIMNILNLGKLARQASGLPLQGPEPALAIPRFFSKRGHQGLDHETTPLYLERFDRSQTW